MGASARAIAAFTMIPFTVLKTRCVANIILFFSSPFHSFSPQVRIWQVHLRGPRFRPWTDPEDRRPHRPLQGAGTNPYQVQQPEMRKGSNIPSHSLPTCRDVPFSALYLASYEMLKQEIPSKIDASPNTCHFLAGLGMHLSYIHNETVKNRGETTGHRCWNHGKPGHPPRRCGQDSDASGSLVYTTYTYT